MKRAATYRIDYHKVPAIYAKQKKLVEVVIFCIYVIVEEVLWIIKFFSIGSCNIRAVAHFSINKTIAAVGRTRPSIINERVSALSLVKLLRYNLHYSNTRLAPL